MQETSANGEQTYVEANENGLAGQDFDRQCDSSGTYPLDITSIGGRLGALRTQLKPGKIISLQRGSTKADFRVQWSRQLGPNELQAGIESLQPILLDVRSHHSKSVM